ncbi:MFS transporter [Crocosphaera chwakensis]|uniref:Uncharacterized protein n=1 Tax=Crocosphaera chwakensis CCY0110 TaxID=391612 RepID=A3ILP2_9CHRO|nr:MFS transporter [Crocosphaera chwakensis]EAZ92693.1 hypothetical protein CY0110_24041 [Crocosphaera chwakensis CCY0110]
MLQSPLRLSHFRWLWLGQTLIFAAAEFWFIALTWLVLQKTGSGLAVGAVLIAAAVPRGLLMLVGGAISDRFPANHIASIAAVINTFLTGLVTVLLIFNTVDLKYLIISAILFGLSEAILYPAVLALLPKLIKKSQLNEANAWIQGSEQLSDVIVPASVGLIIGALGLQLAFAINTLTFVLGSMCLLQIGTLPQLLRKQPKTQTLKDEIVIGLAYAWKQPAIRISLFLLAMINFAMLGPLVVGVAALVNARFEGNATTFGYLQSAYGIGSLLGAVLASQLGRIKSPKMALTILCYGLGAGLIVLGCTHNVWMTWGVIALMGIGCGLVTVLGITWIQENTASQMEGRVMSLVMFAAASLDPFSQAITGALLEISLTGLYLGAGVIMFLTAITSSFVLTPSAQNPLILFYRKGRRRLKVIRVYFLRKTMDKKRINLKALKPNPWWLISLLVAAAGATGIFGLSTFYRLSSRESTSDSNATTTVEPNSATTTVTSIGRIVPQGKVTRLSASIPDEGARIKEMLVEEGESVDKGQIIAILDSYDRQLATLKQAKQEVKVAQARLEQVKAGAKSGAIKAQSGTVNRFQAELEGQLVIQEAKIASLQAQLQGQKTTQQETIERLQAEFNNAQTECKRYDQLYREGVVSASEYDSKCLQATTFREELDEAQADLTRIVTTLSSDIREAQAGLTRSQRTLQSQIIEAQATLEEIAEVRPVDVEVAQAELDKAITAVQQAEANLQLSYVRSPLKGSVLELHTRAGEAVTSQGIADIGKTDQMEVIAEIYKTDIGHIRLDQKATITSPAFDKTLQGTVSHIGLQVKQQDIFSNEPSSDVDRKVIEVKIRLDPQSSQQVAQLTNLQVEVAIDTKSK